MKKGIVAVLTMIAAVVMSLFFFPTSQKLSAAESSKDTATISGDSRWLYDAENEETLYYYSTETAGDTQGYGKYELGLSNVDITTNARTGFNVVGWAITFEDATTKFITNTQSFLTGEGYLITFSVENLDNNADGLFETSTLTISTIAENYKIEPVFDYIYYSFDVTNMFNWLKGYKTETIDGNTIYYTEITENTYQNTIILKDDAYCYLGTTYLRDSKLYTKHIKMNGLGKEVYIDASNGAFRYDEPINLNLQFRADEDYDSSVNIHLKDVALEVGDNLTSAEINVSSATDKRTTGFNSSIKLNVLENLSQHNSTTIKLVPDYDQLYLVEVLPYVDGKLVMNDLAGVESDEDYLYSTEIKNMILQQVVGNFGYYQFPNSTTGGITEYPAKFWVKNKEENNDNAFAIAGRTTISLNYNYLTYNYYNISNITTEDGDVSYYTTGNSFSTSNDVFANINKNTKVKLNYNSVEYFVEFKPALLLEGDSSAVVLNSLDAQEKISLTRGESTTISADNNPHNLGYEFFCFSTTYTSNNWQENTSLNVTINKTYPTNVTVYVIYKYVDYKLTISGINSISVNYNSTNYYALNRLEVRTESWAESATNTVANTSLNFNRAFNIDDVFNLTAIANNGFVITGFTFGEDETVYSLEDLYNISQFAFADSDVITLKLVEGFVDYSVNYKINVGNTSLTDRGIMADIALDFGGNTILLDATTENATTVWTIGDRQLNVTTTRDETLSNTITISNLHIYDIVTLKAIGRQVSADASSVYQFAKFSYGTSVNLSAVKDGNTYSTNLAIRENCTITAVYSTPIALISFGAKVDGAEDGVYTQGIIDWSYLNIRTSGDNTPYYIDRETLTVNLPVTSAYIITFTADAITAGYMFKNFETDITGCIADEYNYVITTPMLAESNQITYYIELVFEEIIYKLQVTQLGGGYDGEEGSLVNFGTQASPVTSTEIKVSNNNFEFNMPVGYFVQDLLIKDNNSYVKLEGLNSNQSNATNSTVFEYCLSENVDFAKLLQYAISDGNVSTIILQAVYKVHTYAVYVNYAIANSKGEVDAQVTFPEIGLTNIQTEEEQEWSVNRYNNYVLFSDIPYGAEITLSVTGNPMPGTSLIGWVNGSGVTSTNLTVYENTNLTYLIKYNDYVILINKLGPEGADLSQAGEPYAMVNGQRSSVVNIYDTLSVFANAQKAHGYTFNKMYYYTYEVYTYTTQAAWENDWGHLFYLENGEYKPQLNSNRDKDTYYYVTTQEMTDSSAWTRPNFNFLNYKLTTYVDDQGVSLPAIEYFVVYDYLQIYLVQNQQLVENTVTHAKTYYLDNGYYYANRDDKTYYLDNNGLYYINGSVRTYVVADVKAEISYEDDGVYIIDEANKYLLEDPTGVMLIDGDENVVYRYYETVNYTLSGVGDLNTALTDYAEVEIVVTDYEGNTTNYENLIPLNYRDKVEIFIKFNTILLEDNEIYLKNGVKIKKIQILNNEYDVVELEDGRYYLAFNVLNLLENIGDDNTLYWTINYTVEQKSVTYKTNIDDPDFYADGLAFDLIINEHINGFTGSEIRLSSGAGSWVGGAVNLTSYNQFLYKSNLSFRYSSDYAKYFVVTNVHVYVEGKLIADNKETFAEHGIVVTTVNGVVTTVDCRYVDNVIIELVVQPKFTFNGEEIDGAYYYKTDYKFNIVAGSPEDIQSRQQGLTFSYDENNSGDIVMSSYFRNRIVANYSLEGDVGSIPADVGVYTVNFSFVHDEGDTSYPEWLDSIKMEYKVYFEITPAKITLQYNGGRDYEQEYDKTSDFKNTDDVISGLRLLAGDVDVTQFFVRTTGYYARVTSTNNEGYEVAVTAASDIITYNITLYNLRFNGNKHNKNFELENDSLTIKNAVKISKRQLKLTGINVLDKVYDGTDVAKLGDLSTVSLSNVLPGDDVYLVTQNLVANYVSSEVGSGIAVELDLSNLINGMSIANYEVSGYDNLTASIYPYSLSVEVSGYGTITVYNYRGKEDSRYANLIPIGAKLTAEVIAKDTPTYSRLYSLIAKYLSNRNVYAVGYQLKLTKTEEGSVYSSSLDNRLYLELPTVNKLNSAIYLNSENSSGNLEFTTINDKVVIDLSQIDTTTMNTIDRILLTQTRVMLAWWQILIVVLILLVIVAIILIVFFVRRHQKLKQYRVHDKI